MSFSEPIPTFLTNSRNACSRPIPNSPMRVWSRYDNRCIRCNIAPQDMESNTDYIPNMCTQAPSNEDLDMRRKAEIFKYYKNNAKLSKKLLWSQMVKGNGPNKKRVWATQTVNFTDPNTKNLPGPFNFTLICNSFPNICALPTDMDVPGNGPPICYDKTVPLTRYMVRRTYRGGNTKWPERKWRPGDNGFPRGKSGRRSSSVLNIIDWEELREGKRSPGELVNPC